MQRCKGIEAGAASPDAGHAHAHTEPGVLAGAAEFCHPGMRFCPVQWRKLMSDREM